jgi:hypothetical protein
MKRQLIDVGVLICALTTWAQSAPGRVQNSPQAKSTSKPAGPPQPQDGLGAWESARKIGTPAAFTEFYRRYPHSPHIKVVSGTLRGRHWYKFRAPIRKMSKTGEHP